MSTYKPQKPTFAFSTEEVDANPYEMATASTTPQNKGEVDKELLERLETEKSLRELSLGMPIDYTRDMLRKKGVNPVSTEYVKEAGARATKVREYFENADKPINEDGYIDLSQPTTNIAGFDKYVDTLIKAGLAKEQTDAGGKRIGITLTSKGDIEPLIAGVFSSTPTPEAFSGRSQSDYFSQLTKEVISQLPVNENGEIEYDGVPYQWAELYDAFYPVVAERAHKALLDNNKDYYNWAFEQSMGMSYEDWYKGYANQRVSEIEQKIIELRDAVAAEAAQIAEGRGREVALSSGTLVPASVLGWASKEGARIEASKQFNDVLESINTFRNNGFVAGFDEGFDWVDVLSFGLADLGTSYSQLQLLEKAKRGEELSNSESKVLELLQLTQEFEGIKKNLGWEKSLGSLVGSGLGTTLSMAPSFAAGMAATSRIGTTVKLLSNVAKNTSKKAAVKQIGKNLITSYARGAAVAPFMPSTYTTGLKELQEQYTFNADGSIKFEPTNKALAFLGGYIDTMNEYASEVFGSTLGEILGYGARAFGRVTRLNKAVDTVMDPINAGLGKAIDKALSYLPIEDAAKLAGVRKALRGVIVPSAELDEETKELMRLWGVQDGYVAEAGSEIFGDLMSQVMRDVVGAKADYSDFNDSNYWASQLLVAVLYGGSMNALGHIKEGVSDYQQMVDLGKHNKKILDSIENRELRNKVLAAMADGNIEQMAKELADIDWGNKNYHPTDRAKVMDYVRNEMMIQTIAGKVEDGGRVDAFAKEVAKLSGVTYQGKGGLIMETTVGGRQYYIVDGKPADRSESSMLTCIDKETGEKKAILANTLPEQPSTRTFNEVAEQMYVSQFSAQAEATRLSSLQSAYDQMERPTAEVARDIMSRMGITPPAEGEVITLADGRKARVTQDLENGEYVVRLEDKVPLLFTVPFYSILSSNPLTAEAQNLMIEGKVGSAANKASDVAAMEVENGDVTEETMAQPTEGVTPAEASEAEAQTAEAMAQTEEQVANDTLDMTNVPTDTDGDVDYDAIDDSVQYAQVYAHEAGGKAQARAEVEELKQKTLEAAAKLEEQSKNEITASAKRKKLKEAKKLRERAAFYDKVLPELEEMEEEYPSVVKNEYSQQVAEPTLRVLDAMAKKLGLKVRFVDEVRTASGGKANANINGNEVEIAFMERIRSIAFLMGHEFTHRMQELSPEQYAEFKQMVKDFVGEEKWNALVAQTAQAYAKQNQPFTITLIEDEVAADAAGELVESNDAFLKYLEGKKDDKTFLGKVMDFLKEMAAIFNGANDNDREKQVLSLIDGVNRLIETSERAQTAREGESVNKENVGTKYSISTPSLAGVHNISLDKLRKVIKMGGLANPSVAVIDVDKQTHDDYGEYSLVLPKNMVDARQGKNAGTWAGDAWTPTYPPIIKRMRDEKSYSRFHKDIEALPEAMRNKVRLEFDSFMEGRSADPLAYWYLFEKESAPELVLVPSRYSDDITNAISEATRGSFSMYGLTPEERAKCVDAYIAAKFNGDRAAFEQEMQERIGRLTETLETKKSDRVKKWAQDAIDAIKEYGFDYDAVADFIRDVGYDAREKGTVNDSATSMAAREQIKASNLEADYEAWLNSLEERYGIDEYIFDGYTNSGNRRYLPHTLENVSKWMKKQGRQGAVATFPSFGVFIANAIPKMTSLESIRKRKALLGKSKEEYDAFREKWENVYFELGKRLQPDAKGFDDYGYWRLIEAVGKNNPKEFIKKEYGIELSEEDMAMFNDMVNAIRTEYPARYFETKFERPLQISDFTAAVVPNDIPLDVESRLKDAGVEVIEYEKGDNASRAEAMQKASAMEGVRFSLIGEVGATALDMAEAATIRMDNLAIARQMEERGDSDLDIRMATGWERGADGLWRYELMDAEVDLYDGNEATIRKKIKVAEEEEQDFMQQSKADTKELRERTNTYLAEMREKYGVAEGEETDAMTEEEIAHLQSLTGKEIAFEDYKERRRNELYNRRMALEAQLGYVIVKNTNSDAMIISTRLSHILQGKNADALFTAYPSLRDMEVQFVTDIRDGAFAAYATEGGYKRIELNAKKTPADMLTYYLMHEVQHAIQDVEGFAGGGNLSSLQNDGEVTAKDAYDYYRKIAGEVEARNVSARLNMSAEERLNTLLSETEDVAREDQIFLRDGVEMAMAEVEVSEDAERLREQRYIDEVNAQYNARLLELNENRDAKKRVLHLGRPQKFLRDAGIVDTEIEMEFDKFIRKSSDNYKHDHPFTAEDILDLPKAINAPIAVFKSTNGVDKVILTEIKKDGMNFIVTIKAVERKRKGGVILEVNEIETLYPKKSKGIVSWINKELASNVDKEKALAWAEALRTNRETELTEQELNAATKIIKDFPNPKISERFSLITPEMDADYLSAVERGDMATAQQMVMEAAKLAMPNTKVVDENGNPKVMYHGDRKKSRYIFSTDTFFTPDATYAKRYTNSTGEVYATYLDIQKPFDIRDKKAYDIFVEFRGGRTPAATASGAMDWAEYSYEDLQEFVEEYAPNEYDGFIMDEGADPDGNGGIKHRGLSYVPFASNQIKSADPATYDDNGNVIPLSERFNPEKEDIRYSLMEPTNEEVTFDNFFANTSATFKPISVAEKPTREPDYVSKRWEGFGASSRYWYGEDERGKYVIRESDHWSNVMFTDNSVAAFEKDPYNRRYTRIATCQWAIDATELTAGKTESEGGKKYNEVISEFRGKYDDNGRIYAKAYLDDFTKWRAKGSVRYSLTAYNGDIERILSDSKAIAKTYAISSDIIVAKSEQDYITALLAYGVPEDKIYSDTDAVYLDWEDVIVVNAQGINNPIRLTEVLNHENMHSISHQNKEGITKVAGTLPILKVVEYASNELSYSLDYIKKHFADIPLEVVDEILSTFVESISTMPVVGGGYVLRRYLMGNLTIEDALEASKQIIKGKYGSKYSELTAATMPLLQDNLIKLRDERYKERKVGNTTVWSEGSVTNGGRFAEAGRSEEESRAESQTAQRDGRTEAESAGGEGGEVGKFSINTDMTEEDAYKASLLEEAMRMEREATSNGMDIAQEIADATGWVRLANGEWKYYGEGKLDITDKASAERAAFRWLESKKAVKKASVRKTYYILIKEQRKKMARFLMKESSKMDEEVRKLLDDYFGRNDNDENKKEVAKKRKEATNKLKEIYADTEFTEAADAITQLALERDAALAQIEAEYKEIFEDFDNNPDKYIREHQESESFNANLDMYVGSLGKARKEIERMEREAKKRKLSDEEKMAAMRAVKSAIAKELRDGLGRFTRKYDIQRMMDAVNDARTPYAMLRAIDKAMESLFEIKWRREYARMQMLTKSKLSYGVTAIDASSFLNTFVSDHKITAADARKIMNDYWRGTKANGVSVAKYIDDTTRQVMEFISEMAEYDKARARFSDIKATEIIAFTRKLREKLEDYTSLNDYKLKTALANDAVREAVIDAVDILEMYWKAQELQLSLNDDKHRRDISALEIKAKEITAQLREVNQQIKDLADGKVVVTSSGVKDRDLLRKELQERYNTLLAERAEAYADMYNAMPDIINLMQEANRAVETLLRTGKVNLAIERTKRKEHEKALIDDVLADLASPASLHKHEIDLRDKSAFERIATAIGSKIGAPLGSMDCMLRAIGRNAPLGEGRTYNRFAYAFQKAYDNIYTALEARKKMLDDKCNILWGESYHEVHKMAESTKVMTLAYSSAINTEDGGWKPVENTTDIYVTQAMYILATWNQTEGRVTLERQGFTDESINAIRDALNRIDPRWIEFADWVVEEYLPSGRERYNAVHRDIFGTSMAAVPNYFPIKRAKEKLQKEEDVAKGDVDLLPSTVVGAIKERTSNVVPIDIETSFFEALNENTSVMEAWAEMAGLIQDINTILSNGAVQKTMLDINATLFSDFKKAAQVATLSYIGKTPDIDKNLGTILNRLWAGSKIAFRLNTAFKQLSSALLFAGYSADPKFQAILLWRYLGGVGKMPVALMNGIIDGASYLSGHSFANIDIMTNIEWAKKNMPSFAKRWNEGVAGNELMARTTSGNTSWKQRAWYVKFDDAMRAVTKFGMKPNAFIDAFTSAAGARAVYDYTYEEMRKEGYSEEESHSLAIINAEMTFNTTQQSSEGLYLSPMQMDRSVFKTALSTFMNAPYAMFRNTMIGVKEIFRDAKKELAEIERLEFKRAMDVAKKQVEMQVAAAVARGEYSEEEAKKRRNELFDSAKAKIIPLVKDRAYNKYVKAQTKAVVMVFLNGYAGQLFFNLMGKLPSILFGDDDEEKKKVIHDMVVNSLWEAPLSMIPVGGNIISLVKGYDVSLLPAVDELTKEVETIIKRLREEGISPEVIYTATKMCMRLGLGLNVDTIANIALGLENMIEDGMSPEAILKVMNAPEGQIRSIVGQRREGETAKEYSERVMRFYSILDTPIYEDYFNVMGDDIGERKNDDTPRGMSNKEMKRISFEDAYRRNVILRYGGGKQLAEMQETRKAYNKLKREGYGNIIGSPRDYLKNLTTKRNKAEAALIRFVGADAAYYDMLQVVDEYEKLYIELYEQFKQ